MKLTTQRGYQYEVDLTKCTHDQITFLHNQMGSRRYVWNKYVELYQAKQLPQNYSYVPIKGTMDWASELDSCMFDNVKRDFKKAVKDHIKNPGHFGAPRFKKKKVDEDRYKTTNNRYQKSDGTLGQSIYVRGSCVKLPKMSEELPIIKHRCIPNGARILSATIREKSSGRIFISILVEIVINIPDRNAVTIDRVLGLDYSSPDFYIDDQGCSPGNPHAYRNAEARIADAMSKRDRKVRGSRNHGKAKRCVAVAYESEANIRRNFTNQLSAAINKQSDIVFVEDIDLCGMAGSLRLGKSTNDNGFGMFRDQLAYKLRETGGCLVRVPRFFASSKTCSCCGSKNTELSLGDREWVCSVCGSRLMRDVNAAVNIRECGLFGLLTEGYISSVVDENGEIFDVRELYGAGGRSACFDELFSLVSGRVPAAGTAVVTYVLNVRQCEAYYKKNKCSFLKLDSWWCDAYLTAKKKDWAAAQEAPTSAPALQA